MRLSIFFLSIRQVFQLTTTLRLPGIDNANTPLILGIIVVGYKRRLRLCLSHNRHIQYWGVTQIGILVVGFSLLTVWNGEDELVLCLPGFGNHLSVILRIRMGPFRIVLHDDLDDRIYLTRIREFNSVAQFHIDIVGIHIDADDS